MKVYVGADWSAKHLVCATAVGDDKPRMISGTGPSLQEVRDLVERVRRRHSPDAEVHVLIEAGAPGWLRLLHEAGAIVYVVDPKQAKRYAESLCSSGAKADGRDACTLVRMLRSPAHRPAPWRLEPERECLRSVAGLHEQLTRKKIKVKQQIRSHLQDSMPLVSQVIPNVGNRWAMQFLETVSTPWHARQLDHDQFLQLVKGAHVTRRELLWDALAQSEAPWLNRTMADIEALKLRVLLRELRQLTELLREVDDRIDELTKTFDNNDVLRSVKGIGVHQASLLLAYGYASAPAHRDETTILMGASPVFVGSSTRPDGRPKGNARMRKSTNKLARHASYLLGVIAIRHLPWAKAMYADGRARGQKSATVYRRIARSMHRILTAMVRTQQPYDDDRYVAALKSKGVPWAMAL